MVLTPKFPLLHVCQILQTATLNILQFTCLLMQCNYRLCVRNILSPNIVVIYHPGIFRPDCRFQDYLTDIFQSQLQEKSFDRNCRYLIRHTRGKVAGIQIEVI